MLQRKKDKRQLPLAPLERILKRNGAKRVAEDGAKEFSSILYEYALDLATESVILSEHAERKTILESDVKLARRKEKE